MAGRHGDYSQVEAAFREAKKTATGFYRTTCPFCYERVGKLDKRFSLAIKPGAWTFRCWRCGTRGKLPNAPDGGAGLEYTPPDPSTFKLDAPIGFIPLLSEELRGALMARPAWAYLEKRGVSQQTVMEASVGVAFSGRAAGRIVVPIFGRDDQTWRGWVGRAWSKHVEARYKYPPGMPRGKMLYNEHALTYETKVPLALVEGVFDALPHWPHVSAFLGKPTEDQLELLLTAKRPLVVALDGDAWMEGEALAMRLRLAGKTATHLRFAPRSDPGNLAPGGLREAAASAFGIV